MFQRRVVEVELMYRQMEPQTKGPNMPTLDENHTFTILKAIHQTGVKQKYDKITYEFTHGYLKVISHHFYDGCMLH